MFHRERRDPGQFVGREHGSGRVVRGVQEQQTGARGDEGAQFVEVRAEAGGAQRERYAPGARHGDAGGVRVVVRLECDDLVPGFQQGQQGGGDRLGGPGGHQDLGLGGPAQPVEALLVGGDGCAQLRDAGARRVLVAPAVAQRSYGRLADLLGAVGVGEALAEVDRAGPQGQRGHLGEDRRAERGEAAVEQRPPLLLRRFLSGSSLCHGRHPGPKLWSCSSPLWRASGWGIPLSHIDGEATGDLASGEERRWGTWVSSSRQWPPWSSSEGCWPSGGRRRPVRRRPGGRGGPAPGAGVPGAVRPTAEAAGGRATPALATPVPAIRAGTPAATRAVTPAAAARRAGAVRPAAAGEGAAAGAESRSGRTAEYDRRGAGRGARRRSRHRHRQ
ncbi:hypothetical protein SCALM49S_10352 [Streptomyces californicus]